ncbi:MAG: hypothetical protein AB7E09_07225 [Candidatus Izemoplasmatales bacterium]
MAIQQYKVKSPFFKNGMKNEGDIISIDENEAKGIGAKFLEKIVVKDYSVSKPKAVNKTKKSDAIVKEKQVKKDEKIVNEDEKQDE